MCVCDLVPRRMALDRMQGSGRLVRSQCSYTFEDACNLCVGIKRQHTEQRKGGRATEMDYGVLLAPVNVWQLPPPKDIIVVVGFDTDANRRQFALYRPGRPTYAQLSTHASTHAPLKGCEKLYTSPRTNDAYSCRVLMGSMAHHPCHAFSGRANRTERRKCASRAAA